MLKTEIMAMKINYDSREYLPVYLKYSRLPTKTEYQKVIDLYRIGVGGDGFHEGLNFHSDGHEVKFYIPPTCIPSRKIINNEFIVFSFSYKEDKICPSSILGVHAGARILSQKGVDRGASVGIPGVGSYTYHAVSPDYLTTIFTTPIQYNTHDDKYLPILEKWGNGVRYLNKDHAINILKTAFNNVLNKLNEVSNINDSEMAIMLHEKTVIKNILSIYFNVEVDGSDSALLICDDYYLDEGYQEADKEIGYKGEELIYDREVRYMEDNNLPTYHVEWLSQMKPQAVFDIKTVRLIDGELKNYFLEVKSSKCGYGESVSFSERQNEFFKKHKDRSSIVFVNYDEIDPKVTYKTYDELHDEFSLVPIKYKLKIK